MGVARASLGTQGAAADAAGAGAQTHASPIDRRAAEWAADQSARRAAAEIARAALTAASAETAAHSDDVDVIAEGLCRHLGVNGDEREDVLLAARLHDVGKVSVPSSILEKRGEPDEAEWSRLRNHTVAGEDIVRAVPELAAVATLVRHSHERWDGNGYPDRLAAKEIPLGSRIIFCADAFHAIRSDRPYRAGRSAKVAMREIRAGSGTQFDPAVVAALDTLTHETRRSAGIGRRLNPRSNRLVALLLVISTGAAAAAIARTGLLGEPDVPQAGASPPPPARSAPSSALPTFAIGNPARIAICTGCEGRAGAPNGLVAAGTGTGRPARGKTKSAPGEAAVHSPAVSGVHAIGAGHSIAPSRGGHESAGGSDAGETLPAGVDTDAGHADNGVRDHGAGEGRAGHGQGKGQGDTHGYGHPEREAGSENPGTGHGGPDATTRAAAPRPGPSAGHGHNG